MGLAPSFVHPFLSCAPTFTHKLFQTILHNSATVLYVCTHFRGLVSFSSRCTPKRAHHHCTRPSSRMASPMCSAARCNGFPTPSVSYTLCTQKCKTLSYGQYAPDSLACDASHGVCLSAFSTCLVAGLLPPVRVFGLLNMRACVYVNAYVAQWPRMLLAPPTMQCCTSVRPFARTGVCKHVKERS